MTHQIYTVQQLQTKPLSELKTIYAQIGASVEVADKRSKSNWVNAIATHQTNQVQKVDVSITDPNFQANYDKAVAAGFVFAQEEIGSKSINDGVRWVARLGKYKCWNTKLSSVASLAANYLGSPLQQRHLTDEQTIAQAELNAHIDQQAEEIAPAENCILEPIGKTDLQTAYNVKENGVGLGLIFHIHATNTWQCCDGQDYEGSVAAIAGLIKLTTKTATVAENRAPETKPKSATYTKAAAQRLLPFAKIEVVRELRNIIQVTYRTEGKKSSTFLSKKLFAADFNQLRVQGAAEIEVVENHGDTYIVKSKDNYYTVRPNHSDPHQRCECGDCHYRGSKCKHQIALSEYLLKELQAA